MPCGHRTDLTFLPAYARQRVHRPPAAGPYAGCAARLAGAFLLIAAAASGQTDAPRPVPIARFVPDSAGLFLRINRLGELDHALRRAHAWQLFSMVFGGPQLGDGSVNLRAAIIGFLGPSAALGAEALSPVEVSIAADHWSQAASAVWFFRFSSEKEIDRWFPPAQRQREHRSGGVHFFRTPNGLSVAARGDVVAVTRRQGAESLFPRVVRLLRGQSERSLLLSSRYQALEEFLPARALGSAYVAATSKPSEAGAAAALWGPVGDSFAVAVYEQQGRLDFTFSAARASPRPSGDAGSAAVSRLQRLPYTTLLACATTLHADRLDPEAANGQWNMGVRLLHHLAGFGHHASDPDEFLGLLGPRVILAWDQDLRPDGSAPQVAVLVECKDATNVSRELAHIVENIVKLFISVDPVPSEAVPALRRGEHLGTAVHELPLASYALASRFDGAKLLHRLAPSWAVRDGWLLVALTREHLERLLDAELGLIPTLATVTEVRALDDATEPLALAAVLQAGLASDVLSRWLAAYRAGEMSLLSPSWWATPSQDAARQDAFGLGVEAAEEAGALHVTAILSEGAGGQLRLGDRIVGIGDALLPLQSAGATFRNRLLGSEPGDNVRLRILRENQMMEVTVPAPPPPAAAGQPLRVADAVEELASWGRSVKRATLMIHPRGNSHFVAQLSLRMEEQSEP